MNKKVNLTLSVILISSVYSYSQDKTGELINENKGFNTDWNSLTKDFMTWYEYTYKKFIFHKTLLG